MPVYNSAGRFFTVQVSQVSRYETFSFMYYIMQLTLYDTKANYFNLLTSHKLCTVAIFSTTDPFVKASFEHGLLCICFADLDIKLYKSRIKSIMQRAYHTAHTVLKVQFFVVQSISNQGGRSCAGARVAPAEKFGLGRKF